MKISVLGTGMVGRGLAARLLELGHDVALGTRNVEETMARLAGTPDDLIAFREQTDGIPLMTFADAARRADLVLNAVAGIRALEALELAGDDTLADKVLLDLAIPLDLSKGLPPTLTIANDDSLGEQIQRRFPRSQVVKSLHTMYFEVMIHPERLPGDHTVFVGGNDPAAKATVTGLLHELGWPADSVIDLGDITSARATEMYSRLFFALYAQFGTFDFNINVVRG